MQFFTAAQTDFDLGAGIAEVDTQGDERVAVLLGFAEEGEDFLLVHEQTTLAHGIFIKDVSLFVGADMHADDE